MKMIVFIVMCLFVSSFAIGADQEGLGSTSTMKNWPYSPYYESVTVVSVRGEPAKYLWNGMLNISIENYDLTSITTAEKRSSDQLRCIRSKELNTTKIWEYSCHIYVTDLINGKLGQTPPN